MWFVWEHCRVGSACTIELDLLAWDVKAMVLHSFATAFTLRNVACIEVAITETWHVPYHTSSSGQIKLCARFCLQRLRI